MQAKLPQQLASDTQKLIIIYFLRQVRNVNSVSLGSLIKNNKLYVAFFVVFCIIILVCFCNSVQLTIASYDLEANLHPASEGNPNVFISDRTYASRVTAPIVGNNRLYINFSELDMVQVFDLSGMYLFTINFADNAPNGSSFCFADKEAMYYMERKHGHTYIFCDTELVADMDGKIAGKFDRKIWNQRDKYKSRIDEDQNIYWIRGADIVRTLPNGEIETVIDRNDLYSLFQGHRVFDICSILFWPFIFACIFLTYAFAKSVRKGRRNYA